MTVINCLELDNIQYIKNDIKEAIVKNIPIENKLNIIICVSNPCQYAVRYIRAREFIYRMEKDHSHDVNLYIVELIYNNQKYQITEKNNPKHLQLHTNSEPLWMKENLWNLGIKLLPSNWKHVAFCDADIDFTNPHFAIDTLKILNGCRDIIQMHSHHIDMDLNENAMLIGSSFGYQYSIGKTEINKDTPPQSYPHPGYSLAMTRHAFEQLNGIFQESILGSGDHNLMLCLIQKGLTSINEHVSNGYKKSILEFEKKCIGLRLGHTPGVIRHFFHGSKKSRGYSTRWKILVKHKYDPYEHVTYEKNGIMIPSINCPKELLDDIKKYFESRNEDEYYLEYTYTQNIDNLIKFKLNDS